MGGISRSPPTSTNKPRAEVVKIEHPTRGDDTRAWGPPYAKYKEGSGKEGPGESAYFLAVLLLEETIHMSVLTRC